MCRLSTNRGELQRSAIEAIEWNAIAAVRDSFQLVSKVPEANAKLQRSAVTYSKPVTHHTDKRLSCNNHLSVVSSSGFRAD